MIESIRQLTLGSAAKNSSKSSGTGTQGPEISITSIILLQFPRCSLVGYNGCG